VSGALADRRIVRRVVRDGDGLPEPSVDPAGWPFTMPAVTQLLRDGLDLAPGVTFLVGENGSGKSTLVEAIAMAYGLSPEGGSTGAAHSSRTTESPLHKAIRLERSPGAPRWGFFLRAETMHGFYTYLEENPGKGSERFHFLSHGESFLEVLRTRFNSPGFYCLDEPESALSFSSCLALVGVLDEITQSGGQGGVGRPAARRALAELPHRPSPIPPPRPPLSRLRRFPPRLTDRSVANRNHHRYTFIHA
jgi:predicted ATPase